MTPKQDETRLDRRNPRGRFVVPPCQHCQQATGAVVSRTPYVLYLRCHSCGHVWSVPKPTRDPLGS